VEALPEHLLRKRIKKRPGLYRRRFDSGKSRICQKGSLSNQAQGGAVSVCSEKVLDSRPGDHLPGTDVLTRYPFLFLSDRVTGCVPLRILLQGKINPNPNPNHNPNLGRGIHTYDAARDNFFIITKIENFFREANMNTNSDLRQPVAFS
jgi:hypothetical protein